MIPGFLTEHWKCDIAIEMGKMVGGSSVLDS